eukprot:TRINITY_DN1653_c0_g1_i1.p1 TRINITY_DN1653_c0_g1~~TRINITY_DN1653_c0_g1_i1.p1  ORF type:complete len:394 (+),score=112.76 TRINITY_DN1653_c0_g1_i1:63-1184(+)
MKTAACLMAATIGLSSAADSQPWLYTETNANRGPSRWGDISGNEVCKTGRSQSPVNIVGTQIDRTLRKLEFSYTSTNAYTVLNNQHSEKVQFSTSPGSFVDPALGDKKFNALQFHVHSPSENGIGGGLYDMELHIVHEADASQTGSTTQYSHAVIAILFEAAGSTPNKALDTFWDRLQPLPLSQAAHYAAPDSTYTVNEVTALNAIDIDDLLTTDEYYTFDGSLTTPPCTEGVKWYVLTVPNKMSTAQLNFHNTQMDFAGMAAQTPANGRNYAEVFGNNRPLQPLNSRVVKRYAPDTGAQVADTNGNVIDVNYNYNDSDDETEQIAIAALVITCVTFVMLLIFIIYSCCCASNSNDGANGPDKDDSSSSSDKK